MPVEKTNVILRGEGGVSHDFLLGLSLKQFRRLQEIWKEGIMCNIAADLSFKLRNRNQIAEQDF